MDLRAKEGVYSILESLWGARSLWLEFHTNTLLQPGNTLNGEVTMINHNFHKEATKNSLASRVQIPAAESCKRSRTRCF